MARPHDAGGLLGASTRHLLVLQPTLVTFSLSKCVKRSSAQPGSPMKTKAIGTFHVHVVCVALEEESHKATM